MNLSLIQNLSWLGSAALAGYLGWYLYDFKQHQLERLAAQPDDVYRAALEDVTRPEPVSTAEFDHPVVVRVYHNLNWTGEPPPVVVEIIEETVPGQDAPKIAVATLLDVLFIRAASFTTT